MRTGRNDPCPCASGKKFKHCCGRQVAPAAPAAVSNERELGVLVGLVSQGQPAEAEVQARGRLERQPDSGILWKILSVALLRQGKEALPALQRAAELRPQDAEAHANLGAELRERGAWEAALVSLRRALALDARNPEALIDAADAQRALGRLREAVPLYQRGLQIDPRRRDALNNFGSALLELGQGVEAVQCFRRALELEPTDAQVLCNLANALRQLGQVEEAIRRSREAIARAPGLSMAHNNLALLLLAQGEREAAIGSFREAVRLSPTYIEALSNLGYVLHQQGEHPEALALYHQAVTLDPRRPDSQCNLGYALLEARRPAQAGEAFSSALGVQPNHGLARLGLAAAQRVQGQFSEAQANCEAALALEPNNAEVHALLGELRADRGEFAQAQESFQRAIAVAPELASAYGGIAALRRMTREDTAWLAGAEALLTRELPLTQQAHLHFALGKYYDDVAEYDRAFGHYRKANELTKVFSTGYDRAGLTALIERVIGFSTSPRVRQGRAGASASQLPVFIIGMPRSGTSLVEQILASHPAAFGAGEVRFWDRTFPALERRAQEGELLEAALARVAQEYLTRVTALAGDAQRITDKLPANFLYAGLIHAVFPRARFIHVQRHPFDTCLSVYFQHFFNVTPYANDLGSLAHYYGEYRRITDYWRSVLPPETLLEVPYEGLIEDAESWTRRMLDFIGLPWDPRCLEFHQTERVVITASRWQVRQRLHGASVGRWRNYEKHLGALRPLADPPPQP